MKLQNITNDFCCESMSLLIADIDCPLKYNPRFRSYILTIPEPYLRKNEICVSFSILYCPRCSTPLPKDLSDEWSEIVEKEYGITDEWNEEQLRHLPQEFFTDEWWKKRRL